MIPKALKKRGMYEHMVAGSILDKCRAWIAQSMGRQSPALHVVTYADGWISVEADNPIALTEFSQRQKEMMDSLRKDTPEAKLLGVCCVRAKS